MDLGKKNAITIHLISTNFGRTLRRHCVTFPEGYSMSWVKELECFPETPLGFLLRSTPGTGARRLGALGDLWKISTLQLSLTVQGSQKGS